MQAELLRFEAECPPDRMACWRPVPASRALSGHEIDGEAVLVGRLASAGPRGPALEGRILLFGASICFEDEEPERSDRPFETLKSGSMFRAKIVE
jgi:hypothetical protein